MYGRPKHFDSKYFSYVKQRIYDYTYETTFSECKYQSQYFFIFNTCQYFIHLKLLNEGFVNIKYISQKFESLTFNCQAKTAGRKVKVVNTSLRDFHCVLLLNHQLAMKNESDSDKFQSICTGAIFSN